MGLEERQQEKEIDGTLYRVTPLPFGIGQKALMRLLKVLSPVLSAALSDNSQGAMLSAIPGALTEDDLAWFARTFGDASFYQEGGKWVPLVTKNQELHFAGRYETFFRWLIFSIEVNFSGFFSGLSRDASAAGAMAAIAKPLASTG